VYSARADLGTPAYRYQAWVPPQCGQETEVETSWEKTNPHEHVYSARSWGGGVGRPRTAGKLAVVELWLTEREVTELDASGAKGSRLGRHLRRVRQRTSRTLWPSAPLWLRLARRFTVMANNATPGDWFRGCGRISWLANGTLTAGGLREPLWDNREAWIQVVSGPSA
jgi:hypothetical protein